MLDPKNITLSYNPAQMRVLLLLRCGYCRENPLPPQEANDRAQQKLEAEVTKKRITNFFIYNDLLRDLWGAVRSPDNRNISDDFIITLTYGLGIPEISDLTLLAPTTAGVMSSLHTQLPAEKMKMLRPKVFMAKVQHLLLQKGIYGSVRAAQVLAAYHRVLQGHPDQTIHLLPLPRFDNAIAHSGQPYTCAPIGNSEIELLLYNIGYFSTVERKNELISFLRKEAARIGDGRIMEDVVTSEIAAASKGPERFGCGLPLSVYVGQIPRAARQPLAEKVDAGPAVITYDSAGVSSKLVKPPPKPGETGAPEASTYDGQGMLKVKVSDDRMSALVDGFKRSFYLTYRIDGKWYQNELKRLGIVDHTANSSQRVLTAISRQLDLNGIEIAAGKPVADPLGAKIVKNPPTGPVPFPDFVTAETKVARLAFTQEGAQGVDVYGRPVAFVPFDALRNIQMKGVRLDDRTFVALVDGLLAIAGRSISIEPAVIHEGDITAANSPFRCAENLIVKGSLDSGATIEGGGNVTIMGTVKGGGITCRGNLTVQGGIITGERYRIEVGGTISAEFIENSTVRCRGDIEVRKALLSSEVFAAGNILLPINPTSIVAGCRVYVWGRLTTGQLGYEEGKSTVVHLGADWTKEIRVMSLEKRLATITAFLAARKLELQEVGKVEDSNPTRRALRERDVLESQVSRSKALLKNINAQLEKIKPERPFNPLAECVVRADLRSGVKFIVNDKTLEPPKSFCVVFKAKPPRGRTPLATFNDK